MAAAKKVKTGKAARKKDQSPGVYLSAEAIEQNALAPENRWVSDKTAAAMYELDEDWFEAARGGRKEVEGPPFIKIGNKKNSPIRYNLAELIKWGKRFRQQINSAGTPSSLSNVSQFFAANDTRERWLFALPKGKPPVEFFKALNEGMLEDDALPLAWLDLSEWAGRQSQAVFSGARA